MASKKSVSKTINNLSAQNFLQDVTVQPSFDRCGAIQDCNTACSRNFSFYDIKYLHTHFPLIEHMANFKSALIMGNGIKYTPFGDLNEGESKFVSDWLTLLNHQGIIRSQIKSALIYGNSLIRLVDFEGLKLQPIDPYHYFIVTVETGVVGYELPAVYIYSKKEIKDAISAGKKFYLKKDENGNYDITNSKEIYPMFRDEVIHLKLNCDDLYGVSPLLFDRARIQLGMDMLLANISDLASGGINKIIVWLKEEIDPISLGLDPIEAKNDPEKYSKALKSMAESIMQIIHSKHNLQPRNNSVTIVNKANIDSIDNTNPSTRSIEYLDQVTTGNIELVASMFQLHPALFMSKDGGAGAISIDPILEYTVKILVRPDQELFQTQVLDVLTEKLGLKFGKLEFDRLDLTKEVDRIGLIEKASVIAKNVMGTGVGTRDVYDYINSNVFPVENIGDSERYFDASLKSEKTINDEIII